MDVSPLIPVTTLRVFEAQIKTKQFNIFNRLLYSNILYCILMMLHFLSYFPPISVIQFIHFVTVLTLYIPNLVIPCHTVIAYFYIIYIYCDGKYHVLFFT